MIRRLEPLSAMRYPGRGIILGRDVSGRRNIVIYFITGRSSSSQARTLNWEVDRLWTRPTDAAAVGKGRVELLIYPAVIVARAVAVSNGRQTEDIAAAADRNAPAETVLAQGLAKWSFEPDEPIFTPRISGLVWPDGRGCLAIIRRGRQGQEERRFYPFPALPRGRGLMMTTYAGLDRKRLPAFKTEPRTLILREALSAKDMARAVYDALAPRGGQKDYRVAAACLMLEPANARAADVHIINRHERKD